MEKKKLERFSEYSMSTYLLCPRKYRYTYIEKPFQKQKKTVHVNFIFGNVIHLVCKEFYLTRAEERTLDKLYDLFREDWKKSGIRTFFKSRDEEKELGERGLKMLANFYNSFSGKAPYQTESYMENKIKDYVLFGRVDRVDLSPDGSLQIIDYKTTKYFDAYENDDERERKTIQLKLYAYLLDGAKCSVTSGAFYHMEEDKFDRIEFTKESIKYIGEWFDEIINDIRYDRVFEKNVAHHCKYCDFYKLCQSTDNMDDIKIENTNELFSHKIDEKKT